MAAPRQQRNKHSPRALTRTNPGRSQDVPLNFNSIVGNTIVFDAMLYGVALIMAGIPAITGTGVSGPCVAVTEATDQVIFEFGSPPTPGGTFVLQSGDPALRTVWGGYVAALNFVLPSGGPPVSPVTRKNYDAAITGANEVTMDFTDGAMAVADGALASFINQTKAESPDTAVVEGSTIVCTYPSNPDPGDTIAYDPAAADCWNDTPGALPDLEARTLA